MLRGGGGASECDCFGGRGLGCGDVGVVGIWGGEGKRGRRNWTANTESRAFSIERSALRQWGMDCWRAIRRFRDVGTESVTCEVWGAGTRLRDVPMGKERRCEISQFLGGGN